MKLPVRAIIFLFGIGLAVSGCGYKRTVADLEAQEAWDKFALEAPDGP
jgi:hypothetical protein